MNWTPLIPPVLRNVSSKIKFLVWYTQRVPFASSLTWSTASAKTVPTSSFESKVQLSGVRGIEFALVEFGFAVASGATAGALGFAFGATTAWPHAASRLAPIRITTYINIPVLFIFSPFKISYRLVVLPCMQKNIPLTVQARDILYKIYHIYHNKSIYKELCLWFRRLPAAFRHFGATRRRRRRRCRSGLLLRSGCAGGRRQDHTDQPLSTSALSGMAYRTCASPLRCYYSFHSISESFLNFNKSW